MNDSAPSDQAEPTATPVVAAPALDSETAPFSSVPPRALPTAWQPLSFRGVAAFSRTSFNRLLLLQLICALLTAATVVWFLRTGWAPVVRLAIDRLPETGKVAEGRLQTPLTSSSPMAFSRLLSITVDVPAREPADSGADVRVEFHREQVYLCSVLGCYSRPYPPALVIPFNRPEAKAWWGAWEPVLLGLATVGTVASLFTAWFCLALLYLFPVRLMAFFLDREITLGGTWRLASAALLPGALLMNAALLAYTLGGLDLLRFLLAFLAHFAVAWVYLAGAVFALPTVLLKPSPNPFVPGAAS